MRRLPHRHKYRIDPGFAVLGLLSAGIGVWLCFWSGWPEGTVTIVSALVISYLSVGHHPETEAHTGPFARCGHTPPRGMGRSPGA